MPRVLFDINFSNQTFNNSADETDWILSPANTLIIPETATYTARDTNVYVLDCGIYDNGGRNLCFVSRKSRIIKEYELEIEFSNLVRANPININDMVTFSEYELTVDGTSYIIGDYFDSDDYHKYKLRREGTNLYCYIDNNLVYTYDDTAEKCLLQGKLNFGCLLTYSYSDVNHTQYVKATELTVAPYITASSDQITAGDSVQLTVNGSAVSYLWSNGETTASIIVEPTATTIYTCDVTTADGQQITLSKTIKVSADVVYGTRGAVDDDTLFLMNFADGKLNVLKGTLINANCIDDPYYTEHLEVDGVSVVNGVPWNDQNKTVHYYGVKPPFFDNSFWKNATLPLDLTFEWTLYTPEANANGCYWEQFPLYFGIRDTSEGMPQKSGSIQYGQGCMRGFLDDYTPKPDGSQMCWSIHQDYESSCFVIFFEDERLPWLASKVIGNNWSAQGWHHLAVELSFYEQNGEIWSDVVMYVDGEQIKTWHQEWYASYFSYLFSFNEEWFTFMTEDRGTNNHNWYMSEMCITKGRKYNGTFELPTNFYKNYITLANDVLPEKNPEPNFTELAIVNAQGTDAPVMAIKIDCESLSKPICFAQSYHDFVARDDQGELQEFQSSGIQINLPERTNQSGSALSFGVGSISGEVMELCNTVMSGAVPCYLTLLEYLPFDTSREYDGDTAVSPIYTLKLFVTSCQITTKGATITAGWHDTLNAKFPYKRYTAKQFKGLRYVC